MINTIIFDMDGVLIDSEPLHQSLEQELFKELGLPVDRAMHLSFLGTSSKNMWEKLAMQFNKIINIEEIVEVKRGRFRTILASKGDLEPIPGVRPLLEALKKRGYNLILASSSVRVNINLILKLLKIDDYFPHRVSGAELVRSKPDPAIFLEAARLGDVPPSNCLVIEDSSNGVKAAKAAGMYCIGYKNVNSGEQDFSLADCVITNFDAVIPILDQL